MNQPREPFPLDGGRAGLGVRAEQPEEELRKAAPARPDLGSPALGGVSRARRLRREMTLAERMLWSALRKLGQNWRRQAPIGPFVVDFVRHGDHLVVELDGYYHRDPERQARDAERTAYLNKAGFRVVRFDEAEVRNGLERVIAVLEPFPLEGGRAGLGVSARTPPDELRKAVPETSPSAPVQPYSAQSNTFERAPPSPTLPPSRGEGA